jgi:hypothetical protein
MNQSSNDRNRSHPSQPDRDPKRSGGNADQDRDRDPTQVGQGDQTQVGNGIRDGQKSKHDPYKRNTTTPGGEEDASQPDPSVYKPSPNRDTPERDDDATWDQAKRPGGTGDASHDSGDKTERPAR